MFLVWYNLLPEREQRRFVVVPYLFLVWYNRDAKIPINNMFIGIFVFLKTSFLTIILIINRVFKKLKAAQKPVVPLLLLDCRLSVPLFKPHMLFFVHLSDISQNVYRILFNAQKGFNAETAKFVCIIVVDCRDGC